MTLASPSMRYAPSVSVVASMPGVGIRLILIEDGRLDTRGRRSAGP